MYKAPRDVSKAPAEALSMMNSSLKNLTAWLSATMQRVATLKKLETNWFKDEGYSDERGAQNRNGGVWSYENTLLDNQDLPYDESFSEEMSNYGNPPDGTIWDLLDDEMSKITVAGEPYISLFDQIKTKAKTFASSLAKADDALEEWVSAESDGSISYEDDHPETFATGIANALESAVGTGNDLKDTLTRVIDQWTKDMQTDDKSRDNMIAGQSVMSASVFSQRVYRSAQNALDKLDTATLSASPKIIEYYLKVFEAARLKAHSNDGFKADVRTAMDMHVEDLREISKRQFGNSLRSWDLRGIQKEDARIVFDKIRSFWLRIHNQTPVTPTTKVAKGEHYVGLPNYKFSMGETVRSGKSNGRFAKVVGCGVDPTTNKIYYRVRFIYNNSEKTLYQHQLRKV